MANKIVSFEDLIIWQKAQELAAKIYQLADTNKFIVKDFTLKDQLKSASISISDNIAEGFEYKQSGFSQILTNSERILRRNMQQNPVCKKVEIY